MRRLPPLNSLRAFEAAGRHLSFSKAADELCVTPAAISQQIKIMEDYFGEPLFIRITRGLKLSEPGAQLLPYVSDAMDQMSLGVQLSMRKNERSVLTVSLTRTFGSKWLVPRLGSFYAEHPTIDIRLDGNNSLADFEKDDVDLAIRYGDGNYRDLISEKLLDNHIFPVCSPALLKGADALRSLNDLQNHTLLHMEWTSASDTAIGRLGYKRSALKLITLSLVLAFPMRLKHCKPRLKEWEFCWPRAPYVKLICRRGHWFVLLGQCKPVTTSLTI